ncbi:hypothetical protein D3C87_324810 [compost metagenome]
MTKKITAKVSKNIYGNYRGMSAGKETKLLGDFDFDAKIWLAEQIKAGAVVHKDSAITTAQAATVAHLV